MDDFKILKVKFNSDCKGNHILFYKQHSIRKNEQSNNNTPIGRTLFVLNVPTYCTEETLRNLFNCFGSVERVYLYLKPTPDLNFDIKTKPSYFSSKTNHVNSYKIAYVVFKNANSLIKSLNEPCDDAKIISTKEKTIFTGLRKMINNYRNQFVDSKDLQKEVDDYLKNYEIEQAKKVEIEKEQVNQPDDDGWIKVSKANKKSGLVPTEKNIQKLKLKEKKKRKQKELLNFYSFQMRESKKEYIAQLRKKFEEDKKRIDLLKTNRKFKPF